MKNEESLNINSNQDGDMKHIVRAGLGFIGGFFTLWGAYTITNPNNFVVGIIGIVLGIGIFWYAYKG